MLDTREPRSTFKALLVRSGDAWCVLPLPRIRRLLSGVKLFPLPGASPEVAGLAEVEGEPIVVLSLERLLGAPPGATAELPVVLLVEAGVDEDGRAAAMDVVGLLVDEAADIVAVDERQVVGPARGLVRGEIRLDQPTLEAAMADGAAMLSGSAAVRVLDLATLGGEDWGGGE